MARCGMKANLPNPKLLIFSKTNTAPISGTGRYPSAMCLQGVSVSSILCARFNIRCHKISPGLNTFASVQKCICLTCDGTLARTTSHDESVVTSDGTIEEINQFCCLNDVLNRGGGAERTVRSMV